MTFYLGVIIVIAAIGYFLYVPAVAVLAVAWATTAGFLAANLLFGTTLFWAIVVLESIFIFWALDDEDDETGGVVVTISIIIILGLLQAFGNVKVGSYLLHHPWKSIVFLAAYFVAGGLWSIVKWWVVETDKFAKVREGFLRSKHASGTTVPAELQDEWRTVVAAKKTDTLEHKGRFLAWIAYWPWSLVWTAINNPVKRLAQRIYYELQSTYQRITDRVWVAR
jgi:hypothetical protein